MFLGETADGSVSYEVMVWLGALGGAGPISSTGSPIGTPTVGSASWDLYEGYNGDTEVFSFVATSSQENFSGDLKDFLDYLSNNQGVPTSQYLQDNQIGAGTEPFSGSDAVLSTSAYSVSVD